MSEFSISQPELDSLAAKLDHFSEGLTDTERGALLHVFDLAGGNESELEGFSMGVLGGGSVFGPPIRTLFQYDMSRTGKKDKKPERPDPPKSEDTPK